MVKLFALAAAATSVASSSAMATDTSCALVDFTAEDSEFFLLNNAVDIVTQSSLLDTLLQDYEPLVLQDVALGDFSYSLLGQDLTFTPMLDFLNVTGLQLVTPQHINASASNAVDLGAYSSGKLTVDATLSMTLEELDATISADVSLAMEQPTLAFNVQADMLNCAAGASDCTNLTVTSIEVAGVDGAYSSILDSLLLRLQDASVETLGLDFASLSKFDVSIDGSGPIISAITNAIADFSADEINEKGSAYDSFTSAVDDQLLSVLNDLLDSKFKPSFGATCIEQ